VGLGAGATLFVLSRDTQPVSARLSPSSVSIAGRF
jgi:hypothetical protein